MELQIERIVQGEGYFALHEFGNWKIAGLRYAQRFDSAQFSKMERHEKTDEVFAPLQGCAALVMGGNASEPENLSLVWMEKEHIYVVPQNTWHYVLCMENAVMLIMEDSDTGLANTQYQTLEPQQAATIREAWEERSRLCKLHG